MSKHDDLSGGVMSFIIALLASHGLGTIELPTQVLHIFFWPAIVVSLLFAINVIRACAKREDAP